jgi:hypothetical protein
MIFERKPIMHEHCKSCLTYNEYSDKCGILIASELNLKGDCPCTNCLIKVMCNKGCDDYNNFKEINKG